MNKTKKSLGSTLGTIFFSIICVLYMYPIVMVVMNSFKKETAITTAETFTLPNAETFAGFKNYINALGAQGFLQSFGYSAFITISSVALILLCCSMCMVYHKSELQTVQTDLYALCILYGRTLPDGNVYPVPDSGQPEYLRSAVQYPLDDLLYLPWFRCRLGGVHVLRLCKVHSSGAGRSGNDRRLQPLADLLQGGIPSAEAHHDFCWCAGNHVGME